MSYGLESYIDSAISIFTDNLWASYINSFLGRSYRIDKDGSTMPHVYNKGGKYTEVFATKNYDSLVHFDVDSKLNPLSLNGILNVNIFFAVNIGKIYGNDERAIEQCKFDIMNVVQYTSFNVVDIIDQLPAYTDIYDLTDKQKIQFNMQPYYIVRLETKVMIGLGTCDITPAPIKRSLIISTVGNGITNPPTGRYSYDNGEVVTIMAAADEGNEFVDFNVNEGEKIETNPWYLQTMGGLKEIVATFRTLMPYQLVFIGAENEIQPDSSGGWEYPNYGTGDVPVTIRDSQIATFDGVASLYTESDLSGISIIDFVGTAQPTIIDSYNIGFKAGSAEYLSLSNGENITFQEGGFNEIYSTSIAIKSLWDSYYLLPEIRLTVGGEVTIYGDSLIYTLIGTPFSVIYNSSIGTVEGNNLTINPNSTDVGEYEIQATFYRGQRYITKTINVVVSEQTTPTLKIMLIGDSTVANGIIPISNGINEKLGNNITYLGTEGTGIKHEGYPGWTANRFLSSDSPFYKDGVIDIEAYFIDNTIDIPDVINIRLGINEMYSYCLGQMTETNLSSVISDFETLVDSFLNYSSAYNVIISLTSISENTGDGWANNYDEEVAIQNNYIQYIHMLWCALITTFTDYNSRVIVSAEVITLDRDNGYPKTEGVHTNGVHPNTIGYEEIGRGLADYINIIE